MPHFASATGGPVGPSAALALIGSLFARPLLGLFITDAQVLTLAIELLHIVLWSGLLLGWGLGPSELISATDEQQREGCLEAVLSGRKQRLESPEFDDHERVPP